MNYEFKYKDEIVTVDLADGRMASFAETDEKLELEFKPDGRIYLRNGNTAREICAVIDGDKTFVDIDGLLFEFTETSDDASGSGEGGLATDPSRLFAPMPGKIVKLLVSIGDSVTEKQQMVIVEAMKMENIVITKSAGTVKSINFAEGDQCDTETPIIELELNEE